MGKETHKEAGSRPAAATAPLRSETALELSHLVSALWKLMVRATPAHAGMPVLESQVSILRTLVAAGPMPPAAVADQLRLARSTVSNLVRDLVDDGLIERRPSPVDGRSVFLAPTAHGRAVLQRFREERVRVVETALEAVPPEEMHRLAAALPALELLLAEFEHMADRDAGHPPG
ncbi:DNA-binding transcriptional regulator, MarR family [Streptomyces sp. LamerLS-316]|uniref:MarR family winged helix-turn-helix transcriptional regulator n=1 Tax=unclassified Streptomyces TaxID=2593676 RepID=UPI000823A408|nr:MULTISPECIES: MarR family transcriptional regulator [unclassified Streptomyces]MYQ36940.1 MarR family transcriptional regulator [Streptomyces sp. SID4921]SCK51946.1 DNA-binding transcriptional regulator, MarR family [Streptomyces sp. LamerLS-316]